MMTTIMLVTGIHRNITHSKDNIWTQNLKNESRDPDHAHFGVISHPKSNT